MINLIIFYICPYYYQLNKEIIRIRFLYDKTIEKNDTSFFLLFNDSHKGERNSDKCLIS